MLYIDILGGREVPSPGWYLQAMGRKGARNSAYLVLTARTVKRKNPNAFPRITMDVEIVDEIPKGAKVFEFFWYPRKKRKRTFEQDIRRKVF